MEANILNHLTSRLTYQNKPVTSWPRTNHWQSSLPPGLPPDLPPGLPSNSLTVPNGLDLPSTFQPSAPVPYLPPSTPAPVLHLYSVPAAPAAEVTVHSLLNEEAGGFDELETAEIDEDLVKSMVSQRDLSEMCESTENAVKLEPEVEKPHSSLTFKELDHIQPSLDESQDVKPEAVDLPTPLPPEDRQVLDRFQSQESRMTQCLVRGRRSVPSLVVEGQVTAWVTSPYSGNMLKPYIRRDTESCAPQLLLLRYSAPATVSAPASAP